MHRLMYSTQECEAGDYVIALHMREALKHFRAETIALRPPSGPIAPSGPPTPHGGK